MSNALAVDTDCDLRSDPGRGTGRTGRRRRIERAQDDAAPGDAHWRLRNRQGINITFGLALTALDPAHRSALTPAAQMPFRPPDPAGSHPGGVSGE